MEQVKKRLLRLAGAQSRRPLEGKLCEPVLKASHPQTPPPHCTTDPNMCPLNNLIKKRIEQSFATFYLSALLQHREVRLGESAANRYSTSPQPSEYDKSYLQNTTGDKIDKAGTTAPLI